MRAGADQAALENSMSLQINLATPANS
jgi:hypothetical protein